jgi:AcrR family transcriptional regulator
VTDAALLEAAQRAIEAHGYAGATLERIADEAGLSRVTLHRRGVSKDGLLADLVARATEDYRAAMWPALTGEGTGADRLHDALVALCGAAEQHLALLVALRSQSDSVFHRREDVALTRGVWTAPIERLLRDGAADGSLRTVEDPREMATLLFNMVGWTYVHLRTAHGWKPERATRAVLDPLFRGLLASP